MCYCNLSFDFPTWDDMTSTNQQIRYTCSCKLLAQYHLFRIVQIMRPPLTYRATNTAFTRLWIKTITTETCCVNIIFCSWLFPYLLDFLTFLKNIFLFRLPCFQFCIPFVESVSHPIEIRITIFPLWCFVRGLTPRGLGIAIIP